MEKSKTEYCWMNCGRKAGPGFHHLIYQSQAPEHKHNPSNMVRICQECHRTIHDKPISEIAKIPGFQKMLNRIRDIDERHYQRWVIKADKAGIKV